MPRTPRSPSARLRRRRAERRSRGAARVGAAPVDGLRATSQTAAPVPPVAPVERPAISVRDLWKVYGPDASSVPQDDVARGLSRADLLERYGCTAAVREMSFDVAAGEVFVVMGLSGSGKSTLVRCLTRLVEPTWGQVLLDGEDLLAADPRRLRELRRTTFAMVFQHFGLLPHRRVLENVSYGLEVAGTGKPQRLRRAQEVVDLVGLSGYERAYPDQLSGGMQQRVGLARALAGEPDVLFFDEPFSALDPLLRRDMQDEVARLHREVGATMVFITHDLTEALRLGDRILLMRDGRPVQCGTGEELVGAPVDDHVRDFVREVPRAGVLSLRWVVRPLTPDDRLDGPELDARVLVRDAARTVLSSGLPVKVVADGALLGVVDVDEVLTLLAGADGAA